MSGCRCRRICRTAWAELVEAGATDLGGLSANGDHISPEHAFPSPHEVRKGLAPKGYALTERLCVYPQYMDPEWMEQGVLDVIKLKYWSFIPRRGSGRRRDEDLDAGLTEEAIAKGREGVELSEDELTALFAETRPGGDRGDAGRRRRAAGGAGRRPGDLRRQPQHQLHQHLRGRLRLLRVRAGAALAGRLRGLRGGLRRAGPRRGRVRRDRDLHAGRYPPRPDAGGVREVAAAGQGGRAAAAPARLLADGGPLHVRALRQGARRGLRVPQGVRARLDAGDRRRGARRRRQAADLPQQAAGRSLGGDHRGLAPGRACARPRR